LDVDEVRARLATDEAAQQVMDDAAHGQQLGVTGVPFFVFGNKYGVSGAQPPEMILQVMNRVQEEIS
jgi:predicted DsbA family dithiol-disulfide isomerase